MKKFLRILLIIIVVLILIPVGYLLFRPNLILSKAEIKKRYTLPSSHFITWRGSEIHYTEEGSGPTLLLIHGFGGHHRNFNKITAAMKDKYRVIRVDLPGFGMSDCQAVDMKRPQYAAMYKDFMKFFVDTAMGIDSMYVVGNSMGGMVAWNMAAQAPEKVRKLVLLNSAGYDLEKTANGIMIIKYKAFRKMFDKGMPLSISESNADRVYANPDLINHNEVVINNAIGNREGNLAHMLNMAGDRDFPDTALIKQVKCPTLIIWGQQDKIINVEHAQRFKRDIPDSKLIIYDPCGHVPMIERMEDTKRDIQAFFEEQ